MNVKKTFFLILLIVPLALFSQEQPEHQKRIYKSPDGKLYINKDLPVYLKIATSPDKDAETYLLESEDSKKYTNPMYFDTEGFNTIRSPWKVDPETNKVIYPKEEIIFEIYADSKKPSTDVNFGTSDLYKAKDKIYLGKKTTLTFKEYDALSGVKEIYYSFDGNPYKKYRDPIQINNEKHYTLKYYGVDNVGNAEKPKQLHLVLDLTAPNTSHKIKGDQHKNIISARTSIELSPKDKVSSIKHTFYTIDEGKKRVYSTPLQAKYLSEGAHQITYYSTDQVGNEEKLNTFKFYVDKTPPKVVDELIGNTFIANGKEYFSGRNKLKLISMDNKAGVKEIRYSVNDGSFKKYDTPFHLSKSGNLKIQTLAIDNVNNKKRTERLSSRSNVSHVDLSGPNLGHNFNGPSFVSKDTVYISKSTKISLAGNDEQSGLKKITYNINNGAGQKEYIEPFSIKKQGIYKVSYTGYDNLDNTNTNDILCIVDNTGPKIYHRFSIDSDKTKTIDGKKVPSFPAHVVLFLSATDHYVGLDKMYFSLNNGPRRLYKSLIEGFDEKTLYTLNIMAIDKLGNKHEKSTQFYIE